MASEMYAPEVGVTWAMPEGATATWATSVSATPPPRRSRPNRRFPPEVFTDAEVAALLAACGDDGPTSARNRALIAILYRAGLRMSEALALYPKDIDLEAGSIRVLHGKGDRHRLCGVDPGVSAFVRFWHAYRRFWPVTDRQPLFCTREGKALSTGYVRRLLPALARLAGIHKRVHAHGLRHTHAAQLREEGIDVGIISKQLGHRSILTTIRYLDHVAPVAVVEAVRKRSWPTSPGTHTRSDDVVDQ